MTIDKTLNGTELTVKVSERLDTITAPELDAFLKENLDDVTALLMDFHDLEYISSAGLRVLLSAQKRMNKQGTMTVTGANETIMEIFEVTGFIDILNIQ